MKIKKYKEILENNTETKKLYVFDVHYTDQTYRGSIWDTPRKPWVPNSAKLVAEFELGENRSYMVVNQEDLDEINKIKEENDMKNKAKKYNL